MDGDGNVSSYVHDGFDRISQRRYSDYASTSPADYDGFGYDDNGNLASSRLRDGRTIGFGYDALNRKTSKAPPEATNAAAYGYDELGRLIAEGLPNSLRISARTLNGKTFVAT